MTRRRSLPRRSSSAIAPANKARNVLLIGWDAADWKIIRPLLAAGMMPALQALIEGGVSGDITTLQPPLSPMLWTSIATGKRPFAHGVFGFTEPDPASGGIRPVTSLPRRVKAVWNILSQHGLRSNIVGWWPSHPAEPINGVMVSNRYQEAPPRGGGARESWPMPADTVHPPRLSATLTDLRVHPDELVSDQILAFAPKLAGLTAADIRQREHERIRALKRSVARSASIQAAAMHLIEAEPWDFMAVYFDAIDQIGHDFMRFHPPRQGWIAASDFDLYAGVVNAAYRFHDMLLGALLRSAAVTPETTVLLISDHGFHSDHLRVMHMPRAFAGPAVEHRDHGILIARGPGIRAGERIQSASLLDVAPTLLQLFGLPTGEDMDGAPLVRLFTDPPAIATIPSWDEAPEAVPGQAGMHPRGRRIEPEDCAEALAQLAALGYIEHPSEDTTRAVRRSNREADYDLARACMDAGRYGEAIPILARLWNERPLDHRVGLQLAHALEVMGRTLELGRVVETVIARRQMQADEARRVIVALGASTAACQSDPGPHERARYAAARRFLVVSPYAVHYLLASVCHAEARAEDALVHLAQAEQADPHCVGLHLLTGRVNLRLRRWEEAERRFRRVIESDPDRAEAHLGLAESHLGRRRNRAAVDSALAAVERRYWFPQAHLQLGVALLRVGQAPTAARAFEVALTQNPRLVDAHRKLAAVSRTHLADPERAARHTQAAARLHANRNAPLDAAVSDAIGAAIDARVPANLLGLRESGGTRRTASAPSPRLLARRSLGEVGREEGWGEGSGLASIAERITVVSGLPRSGTSMMMRMLAAGGLAPLTDSDRPPDADNPHGYFEFSPARRLRDDASWLPQAAGKAVKLVAQLLLNLPSGPQYQVVFMRRDLDEVLASQDVMLRRQDRSGGRLAPDKLRAVFVAQMEEVERVLAARPAISMLAVEYRDAVTAPIATAARVNRFLGGVLDEAAMAAAVDPALWRQRS
jgi:predicted AlkP superfamily phosphohydrolase/phosphomutase/tetratricopeptide (TPR) repeat protein